MDLRKRWSRRGIAAFWPRRKSLSFRLSLAINLTASLVLAGFWGVDHFREQHIHLNEQADRLLEEAKVLRAAQRQLGITRAFEQYVDAYCSQMSQQVSPGHHIALANAAGLVVARAHARADTDLETKMALALRSGVKVFPHAGTEYMAVGFPSENAGTILVAQSLEPVNRVIRRQATSRAISMLVLLAMVMGVTHGLLGRWVRQPIHQLVQGVEAVQDGRNDQRVAELGTADLQFLGDGFNRMSAGLAAAEHRRTQEMAKARRIHLALRPRPDTSIRGLRWASCYIPANAIGGDYHDLLEYPDGRWLLLISDVAGHGIPAALTTAMLKALSRRCVMDGAGLQTIVSVLNSELQIVSSEHFVTFLAILYDPASPQLEYVNCGHEPGLILTDAGQSRAVLHSTGLPLGVEKDESWDTGRVTFERGDSLCLFTDGVTEIPDAEGVLLGRERLPSLLATSLQASRTIEDVLERIRNFSGRSTFDDDLTLVVLRRDH